MFEGVAEGWIFSGADLLQHRWERCRALAQTDKHQEVLVRMLTKYLEELIVIKRRARSEGNEKAADLADLVLQKGHADRYAGPLRYGRFQVMESLSPASTYYVVDHTRADLLLRVAGAASDVRRFATREAAEQITDELAQREPTPDVSLKQKEADMAKPVRKEPAAPKAAKTKPAAAPKTTATKVAVPTNGAGRRGRAPAFGADAKISLLKKENPKRAGTAAHALYTKYKDGMTVGAFLNAGGNSFALKYDSDKGFIRVG